MGHTTAPVLACLCLFQVASQVLPDGDCPAPGSAEQYMQQLEQRSKQHDVEAALALGEYYQQGRCTKRDYAKSREIYERLAREGNAEAEFRLGLIHLNGWGVPTNKIIAEMWLNRASSHHHPSAGQLLEYMHEVGFDDC